MEQVSIRQYVVDPSELRLRPMDVAFRLLAVAYANMETLAQKQLKAGPSWCIGCGTCCSNRTPEVYGFESAYVALYLRETIKTSKQRAQVLVNLEGWLKSPWSQGDRGRCAFLNKHNRCTIHAARPFACRAYGLLVPRSPACRGRHFSDDGTETVLRGPLVDRVTSDYYLAVDIVRQHRPGDSVTYWLPTGVWRYMGALERKDVETQGRGFNLAKVFYQGGSGNQHHGAKDLSGSDDD